MHTYWLIVSRLVAGLQDCRCLQSYVNAIFTAGRPLGSKGYRANELPIDSVEKNRDKLGILPLCSTVFA